MAKVYITADTHFGHSRIIKYCNRPFSTVGEMDNYLIEQINKTVRKKDMLWILGDFAFGSCDAQQRYRDAINCYDVRLVLGNHDKNGEQFLKKLFREVANFREYKNKQHKVLVTMCHYAMRTWRQSHYSDSIQLYGHSHGRVKPHDDKLQLDVGVDCNEFRPFSLDEIISAMQEKAKKLVEQGVLEERKIL